MIYEGLLAEEVLAPESATAPRKILVVDDVPENINLLRDLLCFAGYTVLQATSGPEALTQVESGKPDLVLLDVVMPGMDGYSVCRTLRENPRTRLLPVLMITALDPDDERIKGIDAGADDFLPKPVNPDEVLARVRSLLRVKTLHDAVTSQAEELSAWSRTLERRIDEQMARIERLGQLRRFLSPDVARLVVGGAEDLLRSHRREVVVVFLDLRGFSALAEQAEPEEVMGVLREYHAGMGRLVQEHGGNLERFTGDSMMVVFNDPTPVENPDERAASMALAMSDWMSGLVSAWAARGYELGLGIGVASGFATIGAIGFEGRWDYGAIGNVTNIAARLCEVAAPGAILVERRLFVAVKGSFQAESMGTVELRGLKRGVDAYRLRGRRPEPRPATRSA